MPGHVKLGYAGALRDYVLSKPEARNKSLANPMAAKLGSGLGSYDDMQNWAGFVMEDWQAGISKKDPTAGGSLYAQAETRFPNRLLLPYQAIQINQTDAGSYNYQAGLYHPNTTISVGASSTIKRISHKFVAGPDSALAHCYLKNEGVTIYAALHADVAGKPGAVIGFSYLNTVLTNDYNNIGYSIYKIDLGAMVNGTTYHIVMYPFSASDTMTIPAYAPGVAGVNNQYNGSAWSAYTTAVTLFGVADAKATGKIVSFNDAIYSLSNNDVIKLNGSGVWTTVSSRANPPTDITAVGDQLWVAYGSPQVFDTMSTAEVFTADPSGGHADFFRMWKGLVYLAYGRDVYYTGDGATYTGPISVAEHGESIVDMSGAGDYLYITTTKMLYYLGFGDQVQTVTPWPTLGYNPIMLTYQGSLYVGLGRSLIKYESDSVLPMGLDLGEGLPALRNGFISAMCASNYWMFVGVSATDAQGASTVWAWNGQGWHFICMGPRHPTASIQDYIRNFLYSRATNTLYIGGGSADFWVLSLLFPDVANYSGDVVPRYAPFGWLETDWFYGGLYEISKDVESVYISCEVCDSNRYVEVYWKDDDSTAWELLGTVTSLRQELRWSSAATRPNTRQIKLGFALYSKTANSSPIIRAIRLKYMTMVQDRWRWTLPITISDNQQMPGGGINQYNAYQQRAHLETLIKSVPPFILEDTDGTQYEVKVLSAAESISRWEIIDGAVATTNVYNMTVEQTNPATYN